MLPLCKTNAQMFYPDPGALNEVFTYNEATQQLRNAGTSGLQLCLDIDTSGLIQPVEILAQVWKKSLPERKTAVLLLNADNATSRTVAVNVSTVLNSQRLDPSYGLILGNSNNTVDRSGVAATIAHTLCAARGLPGSRLALCA